MDHPSIIHENEETNHTYRLHTSVIEWEIDIEQPAVYRLATKIEPNYNDAQKRASIYSKPGERLCSSTSVTYPVLTGAGVYV